MSAGEIRPVAGMLRVEGGGAVLHMFREAADGRLVPVRCRSRLLIVCPETTTMVPPAAACAGIAFRKGSIAAPIVAPESFRKFLREVSAIRCPFGKTEEEEEFC